MNMLTELETILSFENLSREILQLIEPLFEYYACPAGTVIFEQGAPATHIHLLLRGSVTLGYKPYDGPPITLTQIPAGGVIGWSAAVGNPHYTSATVAKEDVKSLRIRGSDLYRLVVEHPEAGQILLDKLAGKVSNRWKDANRQVRAILDQAITTRKKKGANSMTTPRDPAKEIQLKALIEQVSAYVEQFHGGNVEFISLNGNLLTVRLGGACLGCPLLPSTLRGWVAGTVHQFFPEVEVIAAE
jgi:Fe-S cluster biogenesis protein NfuA/CRP-like cAMP-binding protein